jgi:sulfonate transport system substrate-binding protein
MATVFKAAIIAFALLCAAQPCTAQTKSEIFIIRQPGIIYLPAHVMEKRQLIEKHAALLGLPDLKVKWATINSGGGATELLAGSVDIVNTGIGNLLVLWDRTKGGVKGIVATSALTELLVTRNPNIKSLKDFGPADKIAVPVIRISTQSVLLQLACAREFGADQWAKLESNTIQLGHPDAAGALANPQTEVTSHFSAPPFQYYELQKVPGAHVVLRSDDVIKGGVTVSTFFTTVKFAESNPKIVEAVKAATIEAQAFIRSDTRAAVEIYRENFGDKTSTDEILEILKQPGMMEYNAHPQGLMVYADHMLRTGSMKTKLSAWTDVYLPLAHDLPGN